MSQSHRQPPPDEPDRLFDDDLGPVRPFVFDESVARAFNDMVNRSVPGYPEIVRLIGLWARRIAVPGSRCYDLGCSLGAVTRAVLEQTGPGVRITAVDSSGAMIQGLCERLAGLPGWPRVEAVESDLRQVELRDASLVVLNLTLQFLPPGDRPALLRRIAEALAPGGALILVEKVRPEPGAAGEMLTAIHEDYKRAMGYSELAIARKRQALERVLVPDSIAAHERRLAGAGFVRCTRWYQALGFVAWIAWGRTERPAPRAEGTDVNQDRVP